MKIIQTHTMFYVELSLEEIRICPKKGVASVYPIWLGKNRAIMRNAIKAFEKDPPQTLIDCLSLIGRLGLEGMSSSKKIIPELFTEKEQSLDKTQTFW